jgi:hypothetical protein
MIVSPYFSKKTGKIIASIYRDGKYEVISFNIEISPELLNQPLRVHVEGNEVKWFEPVEKIFVKSHTKKGTLEHIADLVPRCVVRTTQGETTLEVGTKAFSILPEDLEMVADLARKRKLHTTSSRQINNQILKVIQTHLRYGNQNQNRKKVATRILKKR